MARIRYPGQRRRGKRAAGRPAAPVTHRALRLEPLETRRLLTVVFEDHFTEPDFDPAHWASVDGASIDGVGIDEPSEPLAARFNRHPTGGDVLQSAVLNMASESSVTVSYWYQRTGGGEPPEPDADLLLEFKDAGGEWIEAFRHPGDGPNMTAFELEQVDLPGDALHAGFQFRFRLADASSLFDDWFVDDVRVSVGPGEILGRKFNDIDRDGVWGPGDEPLADWTVYLDLNSNGLLDEGEPSRLTDAEGLYHFAGLSPDTYAVSELPQAHWVPTIPSTPGAALVSVGSLVDGFDSDSVGGAWSVAMSPDDRFVYAAIAGDDAVMAFVRDAVTGELSVLQSLQNGEGDVAGLDGARSIVLSPDGRHVYVASSNDNALVVFSRDDASGELTFVSAYLDDIDEIDGLQGAWTAAVSPDGRYVYVAASIDDAVAVFSRDEDTGELLFVEMVTNGPLEVEEGEDPVVIVGLDGARGVVVAPDGAHLYVASSNDNAVVAFARDAKTGMLTQIESNTNQLEGPGGLDGAFAVTLSPDGRQVYVASVVDDALTVFSRDPLTGSLTFIDIERDNTDDVDGLDFAGDVIVSPDARHVYAVGADDDAIAIFVRDEETGELTFSQSVSTSEADLFGIRGIAPSGDGRHLYTASSLGSAVAAFRVPTVHVQRIISGQTAEEMDFASFVTAPIWSGRGEDAFWRTPDNWLGRNPPVDGDEIIFEGTTGTTNFNDLPPGIIARLIELIDGGFLISGNGLVLDSTDGTAILHRQGTNGLRMPLTFRSAATLRVDQGALNLWGRLDTGGHQIVVRTHEDASSTISGQIVGDGSLIKTGDGTLVLSGAPGVENSYSGSTVVETGTVQLFNWATLGDDVAGTEVLPEATLWIVTQGVLTESVLLSGNLHLAGGTDFAGPVTIGPEAVLRAVDDTTVIFSGAVDVAEEGLGVTYESQHELSVLVLAGSNTYNAPTALTGIGIIRLGAGDAIPENGTVQLGDETTWQLGGFDAVIGALTGGGRIELDGATLTVGGDNTSTQFAGDVTGAGEFVKTGAGTFMLSGGLQNAGPTQVVAGQLAFDGIASGGQTVTIHPGATLTATGTLPRPVEVLSDGRLAPGSAVAELTTGDLTLHAGSTLEINVTAAEHDRILVSGSVLLSDATLNILIDAAPTKKRLLLIDNQGADPVMGTFAGLGEGELHVTGGVQFVITYTGGDGNDVELVTIATISGMIFHDRNGDTIRGERDEVLAGWTVYLDLNSDGRLQRGEPTAVTDPQGHYIFRDVAADVARVTQVIPDTWSQTTPDLDPFILTFTQFQSNGGSINSLDGAWSVTVSPDGQNVYVVSTDDSALTVLSRDKETGRVSFVQSVFDDTGGVDGLAGAVSVSVSPDGRHVYAAGLFDSAIAVFARSQNSGSLTFVETLRDGVGDVDGLADVLSVTVSPDGRHVYATGNLDNAVAVFRRDSSSGSLAFVEVIKDGQLQGTETVDGLAGAWQATVSPDGNHVYVTSNLENSLAVFARDADSGQLAYVHRVKQGDAGVDSLNGANGVAVSPDGKNVYVAADRDDTVTVLSRDPETGRVAVIDVLRQGVGEVDGVNGANSIAVSPDGGLVYVTGLAFDSLATFTRDSESGLLTFAEVRSDDFQGIDGLDGVRAVTVSPDGRHIYTAASGDDAVAAFARDVPYYLFTVARGQVTEGLVFGVTLKPPNDVNDGEVDVPIGGLPGEIDVGRETDPEILIELANLSVIEGGDASDYTVVLSAQPVGDWTITVVADRAQLALSTSRLIFTPANWDVPQVVSVSALDDGLEEGNHAVTISHLVFGDNPLHRPTAPDVTVNIADAPHEPGGLTGDTNADGVVDITDLNNVRNHFGAGGPGAVGDTNGDGVVDITDLNNVRNNFGATAVVPVPGDTNGDRVVDITDLNNVRNSFGASGPGVIGDTNGDRVVDIEDLNAVRNNFGAGPSSSLAASSLLEKSTVALICPMNDYFNGLLIGRLTPKLGSHD